MSHVVAALGAVGILSLSPGCADDGVATSDADAHDAVGDTRDAVAADTSVADTSVADTAPPLTVTPIASAPIGSEGGTIEGEGVRVEIPPGALGGTEEVSVGEVPPEELGMPPDAQVLVFEPSGLTFAEPITVTIDTPPELDGWFLWERDDGLGYDIVGLAAGGKAVATTTHFSVGLTSSTCNIRGNGRLCHGCAPPQVGADIDDPEDPDDDESGAAGDEIVCTDPCAGGACVPPARRVEYRQWCECASGDPEQPYLCGEEPSVYALTSCPPYHFTNAYPTESGTRVFAAHDGDTCQGYAFRGVSVELCACKGTPAVAGATEQALCPLDWTPKAGSSDLECRTTLAWGSTPGQPAVTAPPEASEEHPEYADDKFKSHDYTTYVKSGFSGACTGHWKTETAPVQNKPTISGTLKDCEAPTIVDKKWRRTRGTAEQCEPIEWGIDAIPFIDPADDRGAMHFDAWDELRQIRAECGVPTPGYPTASGSMPDEDAHTVTLLRVPDNLDVDGTHIQPLVGLNKRARIIRWRTSQNNPGMCRRAVQFDNFKGLRGTRAHAEGQALLQLAQLRQRVPNSGQGVAGFGAHGGVTGGCAEMFTDRAPCEEECLYGGIEAGRKTAGLAFLINHSTDGCRCWGEAPGDEGQDHDATSAVGWNGGRCRDPELSCDQWHDRGDTLTLCEPAALP